MPTSSLLALVLFSFAVSFGAVVSPGPVSAAILSEAPRRGWRAGPWISTGHALLELAMVILIAVGLASGLASPVARSVVGLAGGCLLAFMGLSYLWGAARGSIRLPRAEVEGQGRGVPALLGIGILATASNPFWYAWWATVAAGYLARAQAVGAASVIAFYLGHVSADYAWNTGLSAATSAGRRWLTDGRYRVLIALTGSFMLYLGVMFFRSAWPV